MHPPTAQNMQFVESNDLFRVNMQFSGLNKIHSQLTAYTGQSVHAVS